MLNIEVLQLWLAHFYEVAHRGCDKALISGHVPMMRKGNGPEGVSHGPEPFRLG